MIYDNLSIVDVDLSKESIKKFSEFAKKLEKQVYIIKKPLIKSDAEYDYDDAFIILIPEYKIFIVNNGEDNEDFYDFEEDFITDLGFLSDKYDYIKKLGRPRKWKNQQIQVIDKTFEINSFIDDIEQFKLNNSKEKRISELLISLLTGSINSIDEINLEEADTLLDKVKQKIVLFDGEQTRFIFEDIKQKTVYIQGLAGTGKTELLLHKLKELYTHPNKYRIAFTCFNKVLANNLNQRIPDFFTFMKVDEQIEWNSRLFVSHSWGSASNKYSGFYSQICSKYEIPFHGLRYGSFEDVCRQAINDLKSLENINPIFDYVLIDESQDFGRSFVELCELVTAKTVYVAGDIFQNIFQRDISNKTPDFLLNKVYRTDPRTLMFAQALGLGLYERPVVNWLDDDDWKACGYNVVTKGDEYTLSREKIRRFNNGDIEKEYNPLFLKLFTQQEGCVIQIVNSIKEIIMDHPTVTPDDIGVVFMDNNKSTYGYIDELEYIILKELNWEINRGYDFKEKIKDTLFVSNRNNVKGLEFPFVICVTNSSITKSKDVRNTIYMSLTRSFISSYLIMSDINTELYNIWRYARDFIIRNNCLKVIKPKPEEILSEEQLKVESASYQSYEEMKDELYSKLGIPQYQYVKYDQILSAHFNDKLLDKEVMENIIIANRKIDDDFDEVFKNNG